ncbi:hypothetical protein GCM10009841_15700 [Microlunatus panaciterrae]|uniref:3-methyladenine DNA glycosylase n=1 Tax=Microlunatus panaciterrae TaxID=400768 RepID=A0ABS2RM88_9ACTN|nr:3-methyladenine DNA glycosylase [Microlunatus panaciterrae]MBM7800128.1 hypothetical protein [Microlunatus panaciterrae]
MSTAPTAQPLVLDEPTWHARRDDHRARVDSWLEGHRQRRSHGRPHPVEDFLFEYYSYRPYQLRRWHPGHGVRLTGDSAAELADLRDYRRSSAGVSVDTAAVLSARGETVAWVHNLLRRTVGRPAQYGCFGLHEWAMVYRQDQRRLRHPQLPLRFPPERVAAIVEERGVRCTHFDAYRFFTEPARPLNLLPLTRQGQPEVEQPGCLHANMDLYKWAYKLSPLTPSELVADCFALAREIRELDMRASPYDLTSLGYAPVAVETAEGRAVYVAAQRVFADRAEPLRRALLRLTDELLG